MITYEKRIVVYLDIMGFSEKLKSKQTLSELNSALQIFQNEFNSFTKNLEVVTITQFSDCLIVAANPEKIPSVSEFFTFLAFRLARMSERKIIVRGAVAYGEYYNEREKNILISPALVRAYELERKFAKFPRVIIDPHFDNNIISDLLLRLGVEKIQTTHANLKLDIDGFKFIDYLSARGRNVPEVATLTMNPSTSEIQHRLVPKYEWFLVYKQMIEGNLSSSTDEGIRSKYIWLGNYYNEFIQSNYQAEQPILNSLLISREILCLGKFFEKIGSNNCCDKKS